MHVRLTRPSEEVDYNNQFLVRSGSENVLHVVRQKTGRDEGVGKTSCSLSVLDVHQ